MNVSQQQHAAGKLEENNTEDLGNDLNPEDPDMNKLISDVLQKDDLSNVGEELPDPAQMTDFMKSILGDNRTGLYSQDKETASQENARIALQEFLDDQAAYEKSNEDPSQKTEEKEDNT